MTSKLCKFVARFFRDVGQLGVFNLEINFLQFPHISWAFYRTFPPLMLLPISPKIFMMHSRKRNIMPVFLQTSRKPLILNSIKLITGLSIGREDIRYCVQGSSLSPPRSFSSIGFFSYRRLGVNRGLKVCFDNKEVSFHASRQSFCVNMWTEIKNVCTYIGNLQKLSNSVILLFNTSSCIPEKVLVKLYYGLVFPY